jgi:hypothetical protein
MIALNFCRSKKSGAQIHAVGCEEEHHEQNRPTQKPELLETFGPLRCWRKSTRKSSCDDSHCDLQLADAPARTSPFESQAQFGLNSEKFDQIDRQQGKLQEKYRMDVSQRSIENEQDVAQKCERSKRSNRRHAKTGENAKSSGEAEEIDPRHVVASLLSFNFECFPESIAAVACPSRADATVAVPGRSATASPPSSKVTAA